MATDVSSVADETRLRDLIDTLNASLGDYTPYKLALLAPREIVPAEKNARYMSKRQHDQLVANIKRDGNLSSLPFCWRKDDGTFACLSGHHRVAAAADAGVERVLTLYTDGKLSRSEQVAIQLSHNALVGQDDRTVLRELWDEISDLDFKVYSGLDDKLLETIEAVQIDRINEEPLRFEEVRLLFVESEIQRLKGVIQLIGSGQKPVFLADRRDFDLFFDTLLAFKEKADIVNSATAILVLCEMAERYLAEHQEKEQEHRADERES